MVEPRGISRKISHRVKQFLVLSEELRNNPYAKYYKNYKNLEVVWFNNLKIINVLNH